MTSKTLFAADFCALVGIAAKRFEQRRLRQRHAIDAAEALGDMSPSSLLPIADQSPNTHAKFDALDALRMRAVIVLELNGMEFNAACRFIRGAGVSGILGHQGPDDFIAAQWLGLDGVSRSLSATRQQLAWAMPAAPLAAVEINLSAVQLDLARRAQAQLGLSLRNGIFEGTPA